MSQLPLFKCVKAVATYAGPPMFLMGITLSDSTYISASGAVSTLARSLFHNTMPAHSLSKNKETKKREREGGERGREREGERQPKQGGGKQTGGGEANLASLLIVSVVWCVCTRCLFAVLVCCHTEKGASNCQVKNDFAPNRKRAILT